MAKQVIIAALEEVIGEYVLNIDKDSLKIAALRGKVILENVQLDGDVIGGHILGSIGLSGFGVLSCWAKQVVITIPLKNVEKEVTKIEMRGCHLLCLPLLPATAHQAFGSGNNARLDPRVTLRTRAKRAKLARYEKNYMQGRIPGEGPVARKIMRAVREVERDQQKKQKKSKKNRSVQIQQDAGSSAGGGVSSSGVSTATPTSSFKSIASDLSYDDFNPDDDDVDSWEDDMNGLLVSSAGDGLSSASSSSSSSQHREDLDEEKSSKDRLNPFLDDASTPSMAASTSSAAGAAAASSVSSSFRAEDLPQIPRDWKVKLREKILRNMEASIHEIHVRCEVFEGGLDFCHPDYCSSAPQHSKSSTIGTTPSSNSNTSRKHEYDQHAFAFGATLQKFTMRTANEMWEVGSHEKTKETSEKDHLGPNPYDARHNKLHTFQNFCMYWDDDPPFLISESEITRKKGHKLSSDKFHSRIAAAMEALTQEQEPGTKVRESLAIDVKAYRQQQENDKSWDGEERQHQYIFYGVDCQARQKMSDRTQPGPISCQVEFLPFHWDLNFRPHQFVQYQKLKSAMQSQQRFDTMLRQRPTASPLENPKEWWKYAYTCVTTRPNSRPWDDVRQISSKRKRYIELVEKKLKKGGNGGLGFHGGLAESESVELLQMEDLLPIEALLSFHLIALRRSTSGEKSIKKQSSQIESAEDVKFSSSLGRKSTRKSLTSIFRGSRSKSRHQEIEMKDLMIEDEHPLPPKPSSMRVPFDSAPKNSSQAPSLSLVEAMTIRLGKKTWFTHFKFFHATINVTLLSASENEILRMTTEVVGTIHFFGRGKMDYFFDVTRFEAKDCQAEYGEKGTILFLQSESNSSPMADDDESTDLSADLALTPSFTGGDVQQASSFIDLPPSGVMCRLAAAKDNGSTRLSFSSHPATLLWTRRCFDAVAEFFGAPSTKMETELANHLKHVATPLARKAQLAFLSQSTLLLHVNVAAPKIWVPLFSKGADGAVLFDAGNVRYFFSKEDGQSINNWNLETTDIQVNFVRWGFSAIRNRIGSPCSSSLTDLSTRQGITSVIRPFRVFAEGGVEERNLETEISSGGSLKYSGSVRYVDISISAIVLSLVDAEVLARAIGKWYSHGLLSMRGKSKGRPKYDDKSSFSSTYDVLDRASRNFQSRNSTPHCLSISIDKLEMALEGHSKYNFPDEKSIESHDTTHFGQFASPTRTYVVEVFKIKLKRTKNHDIVATRLDVTDASIVQLRSPSEYTPMKARHEARELQYVILARGRTTKDDSFEEGETSILKLSILHDGTIHLDEVEIDLNPIILRVTPTTLKDCMKGMRKLAEIVSLMTREMERKVHEEGRKARQKDKERLVQFDAPEPALSRPASPTSIADSDADTQSVSEASQVSAINTRSPSDSSLIFKVNIRDGCVLVGRPTFSSPASHPRTKPLKKQSYSFAVVQVLSNALVLFQSIENADSSGSKTLHVSLDNLSGNVDTEFEKISFTHTPPMIGPTGAEFRLVNATENMGRPVSNDVSFDCDRLRSSLTPNDLSILISIVDIMNQRLQGIQDLNLKPSQQHEKTSSRGGSLSSILKYQKHGYGIATNIRVEIRDFSFVVLRMFQSKYGAPEFLSFNLKDAKARLGGCLSALSGEVTSTISVDSYNADVREWEYCVEPFSMKLMVDQMPNELTLECSAVSPINLNLTGIFMRDFSELDLGSFRIQQSKEISYALTPSALSTVGLRRATESHSLQVNNFTGMDIIVGIEGSTCNSTKERGVRFDSVGPGLIKHGGHAVFDSVFDGVDVQTENELLGCSTSKLSLSIPCSSAKLTGSRHPIRNLPVTRSSGRSISIHTLKPENDPSGSSWDYSLYRAEPVVEWCMQNQRLRSSVVDVYSLDNGCDLLSSNMWSPEEDYNMETMSLSQNGGLEATYDGVMDESDSTIQLPVHGTTTNAHAKPLKSNWLRPYLKNDSPEWTDMTCILNMARERVMLPDNNWIWVNDWSVAVSGKFCETTDADGYEYSADFETFTKDPRFYRRGDSCRRRKWTRTRIVRPPRLDDPNRTLKVVWETKRDDMGNFKIDVKSNVTVHNLTGMELSFFVYSPSWDNEELIGSVDSDKKLHIPVIFSSAVYLRLAKMRSKILSSSLNDYNTSSRVMILPSSYDSDSVCRTSIQLNDVSETQLHFLLNIKSAKGIVDIYVEPVLKVVNLLPCQLEVQLGEVLRPSERRQVDNRPVISRGKKFRIANIETLQVPSGSEGKCTALNPASKPHISLRVPGYRWSAWQRIINRKALSYTWRPSEAEEEIHLNTGKDSDADYADELKFIVHFDRLGKSGDPLALIISVEPGHTPTLRVYAQYWIVDRSGFGCRFCESFSDLMGAIPDKECSRRSHLPKEDIRDPAIKKDLNVPGHQWSIGMSGMSLYFSLRERIALSIETRSEDGRYSRNGKDFQSKWTSPMDVSNVMPKTVFSVDELGGSRRFELALSVSVCPGIFGRTKLIKFIPRYQIVNLLKRELVIAQEGCLKSETLIASQSSVPFHWERLSKPSKVRLGAPTMEEKDSGNFDACWTSGCIQLDKIGITSMRMPTAGILPVKPMVIQAEVRLATKEQNSAVVIVIWSANEKSNPLYQLRNRTAHTILCRQPLQEEHNDHTSDQAIIRTGTGTVKSRSRRSSGFECGNEIAPIVCAFLGLDRIEEFCWVLRSGEVACFGFDDPQKPHILEWSYVEDEMEYFNHSTKKAFVEIDAMGSSSSLRIGDSNEVRCQIKAEHSTKVVEFSNLDLNGGRNHEMHSLQKELCPDGGQTIDAEDDDEDVAFSLRFSLPNITMSVVDNVMTDLHGREILLVQFDSINASFSRSREAYHEIELRIGNLQVDNHVPSAIHPVLVFCPKHDDNEPFIHLSAVRRLQEHSKTYVFRYAAFRMLEVDISLDRRTAETIARFVEPLRVSSNETSLEATDYVGDLTSNMARKYSHSDRFDPADITKMIQSANSGRIYFEQLHLHPIRISLTFTQEWMEMDQANQGLMLFQFIRGMASIADAPLTFTSFVVGHVFESPQALFRVIGTHYSSQLTKQIFSIIGSLAILGAPADFISNVGTGVRDFFYEPIQGAVHGPRQFIEGLEAGTQSLARGVFVGVVRTAANVAEIVNHNLALASADDDFIDERKAHQRMLTDAMSRGAASQKLSDQMYLAAASVARGVRSGALGVIEQPTRFASKHGPLGFIKGLGLGVVGAIVKPVVGFGDAAALLMNHVSDMTSNKQIVPKIPKRLRRALPSRSVEKPNCVELTPFDDRAAKAQKIVTGGESVDDVYLGHVNIPSHLIIASEQCLWAIDRRSREAWCVQWEEVSHFTRVSGGIRVVVFSQTGLKPYVFQVEAAEKFRAFQRLLTMQAGKMGNATSNLAELKGSDESGDFEISLSQIPGIKGPQGKFAFGTCNSERKRLANTIKDEIDLIEQCFGRVKRMGSEQPNFFRLLDEEAWTLVSCWGQVFSGLSSRRCIAASIINGTGEDIQIKSTKLLEGGSPCYSIPTKEFDPDQGVLHSGGVIIFFGWSQQPSLLQPGNIFMHVETNAFTADLAEKKSKDVVVEPKSGYEVGFLEKSYDDSGWWAKYWLLVRKTGI